MYWYPLMEWGHDREACKKIIAAAGLSVLMKSACYFCPASKKTEIHWLREHHPALLDRALRIAPEVYEQERQRVAARFDEAVRLAEQAFATEFARLLSHLTARLANGEDGERQVFRDSMIHNLTAFFGRFAELNVRSNPELDALVEQAQSLVRGVTPQRLRDSDSLRQHVAAEMARVQVQVEGLITEAPRRRLVRNRPSANGGNHATAG